LVTADACHTISGFDSLVFFTLAAMQQQSVEGLAKSHPRSMEQQATVRPPLVWCVLSAIVALVTTSANTELPTRLAERVLNDACAMLTGVAEQMLRIGACSA
jgi:hypothetical protein